MMVQGPLQMGAACVVHVQLNRCLGPYPIATILTTVKPVHPHIITQQWMKTKFLNRTKKGRGEKK